MKNSINVGFGLLIAMLMAGPVRGQQIFDLVEPSGDVTASAENRRRSNLRPK